MDLLPSLADHLQIDIPREQRMELDGITLLTDISISHPEAYIKGKDLVVAWEPHQSDEKVKIWITKTNDFKTSGEADEYRLAAEVDITEKQWIYPLKKKGAFYKVVIEGKHNMVNRWVVSD